MFSDETETTGGFQHSVKPGMPVSKLEYRK